MQKNLDLILVGIVVAAVLGWSLVRHGEKYEQGQIQTRNVEVIGANQEKKDEVRNMSHSHDVLVKRLYDGSAFGK